MGLHPADGRPQVVGDELHIHQRLIHPLPQVGQIHVYRACAVASCLLSVSSPDEFPAFSSSQQLSMRNLTEECRLPPGVDNDKPSASHVHLAVRPDAVEMPCWELTQGQGIGAGSFVGGGANILAAAAV